VSGKNHYRYGKVEASMSGGILLLRSGRHLEAALTALHREYPDSKVFIVSQPGTETLLDRLGIKAEQRFIYKAGRFFSPIRFFLSATGRQLHRLYKKGLFQTVAVLWPDSIGRSHINVSLTALGLSPKGVLAVTPEGNIVRSGILRSIGGLMPHFGFRIESVWKRFWAAAEGPELEPRIWHSHFLAAYWHNRKIPELGYKLSGTVVDIGAGTGYGSRFLDSTKTHYIPTDLPFGRDSTNLAISRVGMRPAAYCSGYDLPFRSGSIDNVMALSVLEHVKKPDEILAEAYRVLKPGGQVLIVTPFCFPFHGEPDDFRRWTDRGLRVELENSGFIPATVQSIGDGLSALVLNFLIYVKYQLATSSSAPVRVFTLAAMPFGLVMQGLLNITAFLCGRLDPIPRLPLCVGIIATKPLNSDSCAELYK
jgi:SAM-dependent methyltransferase